MTRVAVWLAVVGAPALALGACGGGGSGSATLSCPTCKPGTTSSAPAASSPAKPASVASASAKAPWPMPPTPQPVQGVLTGQALRDYVLNSARYMIAHPQLMDQTPTIAGITNAHGIRVDIYNWIQGLPMTPAQKAAMVQYAHSTQDALLVNSTSTPAIGLVDKEGSDAINCFLSQFSGTFSGHSWVDAIDFMTANTPLRQKAYMAYNNAPLVDGSDSSGNTCRAY